MPDAPPSGSSPNPLPTAAAPAEATTTSAAPSGDAAASVAGAPPATPPTAGGAAAPVRNPAAAGGGRRRWIIAAVVVAAIGAGLWWYLSPSTAAVVDAVVVQRGPLEQVVRTTARTELGETWTLSTDVMGRVGRIDLLPGDAVGEGQTVTTILPTRSGLLDARSREQTEGSQAMARQSIVQAQTQLEAARAQQSFAQAELDRSRDLVDRGLGTQQEVDAAALTVSLRATEVRRAAAAVRAARLQLEQLDAALAPDEGSGASGVQITSPVDGVVLQVHRRDEGVVQAGTPLMEVGDPASLEIVAEVLTRDAQLLSPGSTMRVSTGRDESLDLPVRRIEPRAFTRLSSLGVEEQRVRVLAVLPEDESGTGALAGIGDGWEVDVTLVTWSAPDVLQVPMSALTRRGEEWAVIVLGDEDRQVERPVQIGHRGLTSVEVTDGVVEGERVVRYPSE